MKTRESGLPPEEMWSEYFDPNTVLKKLGLTRLEYFAIGQLKLVLGTEQPPRTGSSPNLCLTRWLNRNSLDDIPCHFSLPSIVKSRSSWVGVAGKVLNVF